MTVPVGTAANKKPYHRLCHYGQSTCFIPCCEVCRQPYAEKDYSLGSVYEILARLREVLGAAPQTLDSRGKDGTLRERVTSDIAKFEAIKSRMEKK